MMSFLAFTAVCAYSQFVSYIIKRKLHGGLNVHYIVHFLVYFTAQK